MPKDEGCIRYLMKEMDPSEEIEFEREMMGDEDLLIEVESLRKILQKVDKIPVKHPPLHLTKSITQKAIHTRRKQLQRNNLLFFNLNRNITAAAVVLLISVVGLSLYATDKLYNLDGDAQPVSFTPEKPAANTTIEPWVDKNEVLRFSDLQGNSSGELLFIEMAKSMDKLTPVEYDNVPIQSPSDILLTGSSK